MAAGSPDHRFHHSTECGLSRRFIGAGQMVEAQEQLHASADVIEMDSPQERRMPLGAHSCVCAHIEHGKLAPGSPGGRVACFPRQAGRKTDEQGL